MRGIAFAGVKVIIVTASGLVKHNAMSNQSLYNAIEAFTAV